MKKLVQVTNETKNELLKKLPSNITAFKVAKQNLIIATIMPIIFAIISLVSIMFIMVKEVTFNNILMSFAYSMPMMLVFLVVFLSGRKRRLKVLNEIIRKCSSNQLNYRQYCAYLKENPEVKQEINKIIADIENESSKKKISYNIILEEVSVGQKADIVQTLTALGCSLQTAKHASETTPTCIFSNLTEEQALNKMESLESFGAKVKIENVDYTEVDEEKIKGINKIKKNHRIIETVATVSVIAMLILFALPIININAIIAEFNCGVYSFIFANGERYEGVLALLMANFTGIQAENYNNIFSLFSSFTASNLLYFVSVISLLLVTLVYAFIAIVEIIGLIIELFNDNKKKNAKDSVCDSYIEKLSSLTAEQLKKKKTTTIRLFITYLFGKLIRIFLTIYFPIRILSYLAKDPLITISTVGIVIFILAVLTNLVASCVKWLYSAKYPVELNNIDYLRKTIK